MKYPKTLHLPWSPGITNTDKVIASVDHLLGINIVILEKLDGECTSMYTDHIHARSADSGHHPSRNWVKRFWGEISHLIPEDVQICGENVYAKHSIYYDRLETYFYGFMAIKNGIVMSWPDTITLFKKIGIKPVPTICFGPLHNEYIKARLINPTFKSEVGNEIEGYVIRPINEFSIKTFDQNVLKYVRKNHVQTDIHWTKEWVKNGIRI